MIKVSPLQNGNNVLSYLSQTSWHYDNAVTADYEINNTTAVLFLSLRFHSCKPEYIHKRINKLKPYKLRVLLVHVDVPNYNKTLRELFNTVPLTMVLAFTTEECSRYIQGFNLSGTRSIKAIRRKENDHSTFLRSFPKVNKSDVIQVFERYETLESFFEKSEGEIEVTQGFGKIKAQTITRYLDMEFK